MKLLSTLLVTFASTLALAMPTVNDAASYNVNVTQAGQTLSGTQDQVITAYDQATQLYTLKTTMTLMGQSQVEEVKATADKFMTDETLSQILSNCTTIGGSIQDITVPAGTFSTCAVPLQETGATGTYFFGNVPFGLVKGDASANGESFHVELRSFNKGQ